LAEEGQWGGFRDFDICEAACEGFGSVEDDYVVGGGSCDELGQLFVLGVVEMGLFARAFDEDAECFAEESCAEASADIFLYGEQFAVAFFLCLEWDVVGQRFLSGGGRSWGVLEDEAVLVVRVFHKAEGFGEVFFGFTREADDEIA